MSAPVDVLAEMNEAHAALLFLAAKSQMTADFVAAEAMAEARAAVAELIAATRDVMPSQPGPYLGNKWNRLADALARAGAA